MQRSEYHIPKMDCPSEENMIRLKLDGLAGIRKLEFDLEARRLKVFHTVDEREITERLSELNLGSKLVETAGQIRWTCWQMPRSMA